MLLGGRRSPGSTGRTLAGRACIRALLRMLLATMAGEAGDAFIAVEVSLVYLSNHREHLARNHFVTVFIAREVSLGVAAGATHAETDRERAHSGHDFIWLQDLEIFWRTHRSATTGGRSAGWWFLSKRNGREKKYR